MSKTSAFVFALSAVSAAQDGTIWSPGTCPQTNPTEWTNCGYPGLECTYYMDHGLGPVWDYVCNSWFQWQRLEPGQCTDPSGHVYECEYGSSNGADENLGAAGNTHQPYRSENLGAAGNTHQPYRSENLGAAGNTHQPYRSENLGAAGNTHQPYRSEKLGDGQPCDGSPETCEGAACDSSMCTLQTWLGHTCVPQGTTTSPRNVQGLNCAVRETAVCGQCSSVWGQVDWCCKNTRVGAADDNLGRLVPAADENLGAAGNRHQPYRSENEALPAPQLGAAGNRHQPYRSEKLGDGQNSSCNRNQCEFFGSCMAQGTYTKSEGLPSPRSCYPTGWAVCKDFTPYQPIPSTGWACASHVPAQGAPIAE